MMTKDGQSMKKDNDAEFRFNARGARVYSDPMRHKLLDIPKITSRSQRGLVLNVLSVGKFWNPSIPTVTVDEHGTPILYRLPDWYLDWAETLQFMSSQGTNLFPSKVEFGYITPDKQYYAEILND